MVEDESASLEQNYLWQRAWEEMLLEVHNAESTRLDQELKDAVLQMEDTRFFFSSLALSCLSAFFKQSFSQSF